MNEVNRIHLPGLLLADETVQCLPFFEQEKLNQLIAQASAAPEQEPVEALLLEDCVEHRHTGYGGGYFGTEVVTVYRRPDPELARLRDKVLRQQGTIDGMNDAHWEVVQKLESATQRADAAERKLGEAVGLLRECAADLEDWRMSFPDANATVTDSLLVRIDTLLSASAEPAECQHRYMYFGTQPSRRCADCCKVEPAKGGDGEVQ